VQQTSAVLHKDLVFLCSLDQLVGLLLKLPFQSYDALFLVVHAGLTEAHIDLDFLDLLLAVGYEVGQL
jgi:hypothetical protein